MNKYRDIASEKAKENALNNQVYTCIEDEKKLFRFKNIKDFSEIKELNKKIENINTRLDKLEKAIIKLSEVLLNDKK